MSGVQLSRRDYLKAGGALVVTFLAAPIARSQALPSFGDSPAVDEVASFIGIDSRGEVTIFCGKVELGTGVLTAITQIAAEELSVAFDRVTIVQGDTLLTPNQGPT
jgi:CO/xanthine dehydrogenase Mo-binding subunit